MPLKVKLYIAELTTALRSLDENKIRAHCRKWNLRLATAIGQDFWISVHKSRCELGTMTDEERETSAKWLRERGCHPGITRVA